MTFKAQDRVTFTESTLRDAGMFTPPGRRYVGVIIELNEPRDMAVVHWPYDNTCKTFRSVFTATGLTDCCTVCWQARATVPTRCAQLSEHLETRTPVRMLKLA